MSLTFRSVLPNAFPVAALAALPRCANPICPRPPSLWQRWWARHEGAWVEENWYCSSDCLYAGLYRRLDSVSTAKVRRTSRPSYLPLGLVMLSQGIITAEQLRQALAMQRSTGSGRIGQWLVRMGAVSEAQVTHALATQQGCPVFALHEPPALPAGMHWPRPLVERYRAVPVFYNPPQSSLYVGFVEGVDHVFLYAVERMLRCRAEPCIVPPPVFRQHLEPAQSPMSETIVIGQRQSSFEMAETIADYAQQIHAERCAVVRCSDHLWGRLHCTTGFHVDFLFRLSAGS